MSGDEVAARDIAMLAYIRSGPYRYATPFVTGWDDATAGIRSKAARWPLKGLCADYLAGRRAARAYAKAQASADPR